LNPDHPDIEEPGRAAARTAGPGPHDADFEALLDYVKRNRGFDFTGYKRPSLIRRISSRMSAVHIETFRDYLDLLQVDPDEFTALFDTILINVTGFFRDPAVWDALATEYLPRLLEARPGDEPIRLWSAGCASGEEAYTLAMLLGEALGIETARRRVKIYGTDVDEAALTVARHANYSAKAVAAIPEPLLERYFERAGSTFTFRSDLRRTVIFGRHDLVQAAPISHIDLLACRNTIMYFNSETQSRVLPRLHFALHDDGILVLGRAEMLLSYGHLFEPADLKRRIFNKVAKSALKDRVSVIGEAGGYEALEYPASYRRVRELSADAAPSALVVVHNTGTVALINAAARRLFGLTPADIGRPFQDLEISFRPAELRSVLERVEKDQLPVILEQVPWPGGTGAVDSFDIHLVPVMDSSGIALGVAISFIDVSETRRLQDELELSNRDLETAYEELQSTNEELETTNEELQSTIEELETTNEELQSTNEELETINAELQSTNEELQTINDELRMRTAELDEVNDFLESMLVSHQGALVVVDRELRVSVWNDHSAELWGLRPDEVPGQHFLNLDIGLPVEALRSPIRAVLAGDAQEEVLVLEATNRRGRELRCRVALTPLVDRDREIRGAIITMDEMTADGA
jgi:two-component system, chemotaxis family, CheB/CheR fusion protein